MSEQVKFIIEWLNKDPLEKRLTLISFDELTPLELLQLLNDVFSELSPLQKADLRQEPPEDTVIRMLEFLRILKYKPSIDPTEFRQGLIQGDRPVVYPILAWIIEKFDDCKKRAYLARYLVPLDVPEDYLMEQDVNVLFQQYQEALENFKETHKELENTRNSGFSPNEIKKDILQMESEKEQLLKRVEKVKARAEGIKNYESLLKIAKELYAEKENEQALQDKQREQRNQLLHADQKYQRTMSQLKEMRQVNMGGTAETLFNRLEEENKASKYLVSEQLPRALQDREQYCGELQRILSEPAMSSDDLETIRDDIRQLNNELSTLTEKKISRAAPSDDKLSMFRQQAGIIAKKKEGTAQSLRDCMNEYAMLSKDLDQKRMEIAQFAGKAKMLKGEEFKQYVTHLRTKSNMYKKKKAILNNIRSELGVLTRTEEILKSRDSNVQEVLSDLEEKKGVKGFHSAQENLEKVSSMKGKLDEQKGQTLNDMSMMVDEVMKTINDKKTQLAPIIKQLRQLRQECQELEVEYNEKRHRYEAAALGIESNRSKLSNEVRALRQECLQEESRYHYLNSVIGTIEIQLTRVKDEMKTYVSNADDSGSGKKKTIRDALIKKIQEQESLSNNLRDKHRTIKETYEPNLRQIEMWKDLKTMMECKRACFYKSKEEQHLEQKVIENEDRLVL
eukprot:Nk52_evm28s1073 gene=Nk52_evmTU28s1073